MSQTAQTPPTMRTVLSHIAVPLIMGAVMAFAYLGGFHHPSPDHLRIDIVGSGPVATATTEKLQTAFGDAADLKLVSSEAEATSGIQHRDLAGAFVLSPTKPALLVSTGASDTQAVTVERMFQPVAAGAGLPLDIRDVAPVDPDADPSGQSLFFYLVALTVGGYGTAIAIGVAAASKPMRTRIGLGVGAAAVNTLLATGIATLIFHALPSHQWQIGLLAFVYCLAVMAFGISLHSLIGRFTTLAMVTLFVGLNFTTSGGVFPPALQPGFFAALHHIWIGAGLNEAGRNLMYFPDLGIGSDVLKIVGWVIVGGLLLALAALRERSAHRAGQITAPLSETEMTDEETEEELVG